MWTSFWIHVRIGQHFARHSVTRTQTIEVNQRAFFISKIPDLRFEGLHFRVREGASLRFGIPTMRLKTLEVTCARLCLI